MCDGGLKLAGWLAGGILFFSATRSTVKRRRLDEKGSKLTS